MTTYNLTKNDTPKFISCSKKGTPKNGTSRTSIYGSYPPGTETAVKKVSTQSLKQYILKDSHVCLKYGLGLPLDLHDGLERN